MALVTIRTNVIVCACITFIIVFFTLFRAPSAKKSLILLHGKRFFFDSFRTGILLLDCVDFVEYLFICICIVLFVGKLWKLLAYNLFKDFDKTIWACHKGSAQTLSAASDRCKLFILNDPITLETLKNFTLFLGVALHIVDGNAINHIRPLFAFTTRKMVES